MPTRALVYLSVTLAIAYSWSCSGSNIHQAPEATSYRTGLGTAWVTSVMEKVPAILRHRYNYELHAFRAEESDLYIETEWLNRLPFPDERALGVLQARTRIILMGRHRGQASTTDRTAVRTFLTLQLDYAVLTHSIDQWRGVPLGESMKSYLATLERELRTNLNIIQQ